VCCSVKSVIFNLKMRWQPTALPDPSLDKGLDKKGGREDEGREWKKGRGKKVEEKECGSLYLYCEILCTLLTLFLCYLICGYVALILFCAVVVMYFTHCVNCVMTTCLFTSETHFLISVLYSNIFSLSFSHIRQCCFL